MGVKGDFFLLIKDYLKDRKQRVKINNMHSRWFNDDIGVPQGSVLGPILFLIYINDLLQTIDLDLSVFADDLFIYTANGDALHRAKLINAELKKVENWAFKWRVVFDGPKFKCINFCLKVKNDNPCCNYLLKLDDIIMDKIIEDMINPSIEDEYNFYMENGTKSISPVTNLNITNYKLFTMLNKCVDLRKNSEGYEVSQQNKQQLQQNCENSSEIKENENVRVDFHKFQIYFNGRNIDWINDTYCWLGMNIDSRLTFDKHRNILSQKFDKNLWKLRKMSHKYEGADRFTLDCIYNGLIFPLIKYSLPLWSNSFEHKKSFYKLEQLHHHAAKKVTGNHKNSSNFANLID